MIGVWRRDDGAMPFANRPPRTGDRSWAVGVLLLIQNLITDFSSIWSYFPTELNVVHDPFVYRLSSKVLVFSLRDGVAARERHQRK